MHRSSLPTSRSRRQRLALPALLAVGLVAPAAAQADLHVSKSGSDAGSCSALAPCLTVGKALSVSADGDWIHVGPGVYDETLTSTKDIRLVGAGGGTLGQPPGPGDTVIAAPASKHALRLTRGGGAQHLRLIGGSAVGAPGGSALEFRVSGAANSFGAEDVVAIGGAGTTAGSVIDVRALNGATVNGSLTRVQAAQRTSPKSLPAVATTGKASLSLTDVTIDPLHAGVSVGAQADVTGRGLSIVDPSARTGINVTGGGRLHLYRSRIVTGETGLSVAADSLNTRASHADVDNSLIAAVRSAGTTSLVTAVRLSYAGMSVAPEPRAELVSHGSTFVTRGPDVDAALHLSTTAGGVAAARVRNTVLRATDTYGPEGDADIALVGSGIESVISESSSYTSVQNSGSGGIPAPGTATNIAGDPRFADEAAKDWSLRADSPLIDAGNPELIGGDQDEPQFDVDGKPREIDGDGDGIALPDVGASERLAP